MSPTDGFAYPPEDPAALRAAAGQFGTLSRDLHTQRRTTTNAVTEAVGQWRGQRKESFTLAAGGTQVQLKTAEDSFARAAELLHSYAAAVDKAIGQIDGYRRTAQAARSAADDHRNQPANAAIRQYLADEATTANSDGQTLAAQARADVLIASARIAAELEDLIDDVVPGTGRIPANQLARAVDTQLGLVGLTGQLTPQNAWSALTGAMDSVPSDAVRADGSVDWTLAFAHPQLPAPTTDPSQIAQWWAGLTPSQQAFAIEHDHGASGRLRGLPSTIADEANRLTLAQHTAALTRQLATLGPGDAVQVSALRSRLKQDQMILKVISSFGPGTPPSPVLLLAYDPNGVDGQTGVAISYGNPDLAANVAVFVPGTSHSAADFDSTGGNGSDLYKTMSGTSKAVVVWLDGPEPPTLTDAGADHWADDGAPHLVNDLAGLRAAHEFASGQPGHVTAIGHSYGSYIVGKAMTEGASASVDDVVFIGSPGVGVNHASNLGIDPDHVWDGEAGDDPILFVQKRFTPNPMTGNNPEDSAFGDQHFSVAGSHGHSQYLTPRSESLQNIAAIASGDYGAVHRVDAPDYRGPRELVSDGIATLANPIETDMNTAKDLLTGHPIKAGQDALDGAGDQVKNVVHDGEDIIDTGGSVAKKAWDWIS